MPEGYQVKVDFEKVMKRLRAIRAEISENDSAERFNNFLGVDTFLRHASFSSDREVVLKEGDHETKL